MKTSWNAEPLNPSHAWVGCLVSLAPTESRADEWHGGADHADAADGPAVRPRERLVDGLLAVIYVAACACFGLAGALWL